MAKDKSIKRAQNFNDLSGRRFGRLNVLGFAYVVKRKTYWTCLCDCGRTIITTGNAMISGNTSSCGCLKRDRIKETHTSHGMSTSAEYSSWQAAKNRCFNPECVDYPGYGGRGITMCEEWKENFAAFLEHVGPRPHGTSLNRINNDTGYEPGNVEWATQKTQCRNKRGNVVYTYDGLTLTMAEWSERTGIPYTTISSRHRLGLHLLVKAKRRGRGGRFE